MENKFFDRKNYLNLLRKRIGDLKFGYRQNIAMIGDELVGKTSLVFKLLNNFHDPKIVILYLQLRPEALNSFARRFIGVLLYNFLAPSGISLKEDLNFLINKAARYIPRTTEKINFILNCLEKRKKENVFSELLSLCELISQESTKSCVVIFDEFHHLESLGLKKLYPEWSKILVTQKNTMYIIISSLKFKTKTILSKDLSLLFGNFEVIEVEPFDTRTSEEYLSARLKNVNLKSALKDFIVYFTGGYPFYLELITNALGKSAGADSIDILQDLLFESSGILNQKFSNYLKKFTDSPFSQQYLSALYLISSGHNRIKDIAHLLRIQKDDLNTRLNVLLESDVLSRSGDFLKINDRVFGFWLKFVYREKLNSLTFDAKNQKIAFRDYLEGIIQEFYASSEKTVIERIAELLQMFEDDTIQIDRKKMKLTHFREVKPLEFNNRDLKEGLIGRSSDSLWIMAFKNDALTEDYVTDFIKECRRYRHKTQKKIIVTLKGIDANARLRALEEKIWMWDLENLNQIFDLFSRPRIIASSEVIQDYSVK